MLKQSNNENGNDRRAEAGEPRAERATPERSGSRESTECEPETNDFLNQIRNVLLRGCIRTRTVRADPRARPSEESLAKSEKIRCDSRSCMSRLARITGSRTLPHAFSMGKKGKAKGAARPIRCDPARNARTIFRARPWARGGRKSQDRGRVGDGPAPANRMRQRGPLSVSRGPPLPISRCNQRRCRRSQGSQFISQIRSRRNRHLPRPRVPPSRRRRRAHHHPRPSCLPSRPPRHHHRPFRAPGPPLRPTT